MLQFSLLCNGIWFISKWKLAILLNGQEDGLPNFIFSLWVSEKNKPQRDREHSLDYRQCIWSVCAALQSGESVCLSWKFRIIHWKINFCTGATSPAIRQVTTFPHRSGGGFVMATTSSWAHEMKMKLLRPSGGVLWSHFTVLLLSHYHWTPQGWDNAGIFTSNCDNMVGTEKKKSHDHLRTTGIKTKTPPSQCPNPKQNINMKLSTSTTRARAAEECGRWPAHPQHLTLFFLCNGSEASTRQQNRSTAAGWRLLLWQRFRPIMSNNSAALMRSVSNCCSFAAINAPASCS